MPTFQNQTIVVPFDFSAPSINALNQVREWADESNTIHMIYVVVPTLTGVNYDPPILVPPNLDLDTKSWMLEKMKKEYQFANVIHHCVIGDPGSAVVELARQEKADVIVMPSQGRTGISRMFLGSVAERVLRLSKCPVFILRGDDFENDDARTEKAVATSAAR